MRHTSVVKVLAAMAIFVAMADAQQSVFIKLIPNQGESIPAPGGGSPSRKGWLEVNGLSLNVEQVLNIGSQSTGAGAGKITFNPLTFTLVSTALDAKFFTAAASGTPYKEMLVEFVGRGGEVAQRFVLKLVALKTIEWVQEPSDGALKMKVSVAYGGLYVGTQQAGGAGWNRVTNTAMAEDAVIR
jgi:type VI protein secretion system component Hcp